jgi:hypothetical protein
MNHKVKVSVVRMVQFRTEYTCATTGKVKGWNTKFQRPGLAAEEWARGVASRWENKHFSLDGGAAYHNMTDADYQQKSRIYDKAFRRVLPVFKRLLAP